MKGVSIRGGTPFYNERVGGLGLFGLKTLCPFWSGIGYGFRGNYGSVHEWTYLSFQFQMSKERNRNVRIRNAFGEFFCFHSNLVEGLNGVKRVA